MHVNVCQRSLVSTSLVLFLTLSFALSLSRICFGLAVSLVSVSLSPPPLVRSRARALSLIPTCFGLAVALLFSNPLPPPPTLSLWSSFFCGFKALLYSFLPLEPLLILLISQVLSLSPQRSCPPLSQSDLALLSLSLRAVAIPWSLDQDSDTTTTLRG